MYLFELDQEKALVSKIVALTNQLETDIEGNKINADDYTVDELLDYFQKYDVILDVNDLYNMIKVPPLSTIIKNIQGDKVVFKGHDEIKKKETDYTPEKSKEIVKKMAKSAIKI